MFNPQNPYNDLPLLPPKLDLETKEVLKRCISATRSLAELKGAGDLIPNQSILINSIPLQEAQASSEIENIVTTEDELFKAAAREAGAIDPATKEVLRYRTALKKGFDLLQQRPLSTNLFIDLCGILLNTRADVRAIPGTALVNQQTGETVYTPPVGRDLLLEKLSNLERYMHMDNGVDPLIKLAVMHYQFEAIHPFSDGNGRTGRIINILYLVQNELLRIPVLYLSRYVIQNKTEYYRLLRAVTEKGEWEPWVLFMLSAIDQTAQSTCRKVREIRQLLESTTENCRKRLPKAVFSKDLMDCIFIHPYTKIGFIVEAGIAKRQTATHYLNELEKIGVLKSQKFGRERVFFNDALLHLLTNRK